MWRAYGPHGVAWTTVDNKANQATAEAFTKCMISYLQQSQYTNGGAWGKCGKSTKIECRLQMSVAQVDSQGEERKGFGKVKRKKKKKKKQIENESPACGRKR